MRLPRTLALLALLSAAIWLPRGLALDRFVTVDEPTWLTFSGNFYRALAKGDLGNTFQIGHPGVTTTWLGSAAFRWRYPGYANDATGHVDWVEREIGPFLRAHGHDPVEVLATGRALQVAAITLILLAVALAAARLVGTAPALLGVLLIAGDPFHIALSRVLHVDALVSSLMLLSLLVFLCYMRERRRRDLILSGIVAGLAWLTKAPAAFLVPFLGALLVSEVWLTGGLRRRPGLDELRTAGRPLVIWAGVGLAVFVLAWPAMWVDPVHSAGAIAAQAIGYAGSGHTEAPQFFNGAIVRGNPGPHFYPVTFLWRTTPIVLAGLAFALVALAAPAPSARLQSQRRLAFVLTVYALLFMGFMTLGAKKFDRYLLPAHVALDFVAALGWVAAAHWLAGRSAVVVGLATAGQFATTLPAFPYYFSYYNPLLGGTERAARVMMIGWGEGLDQAARYLNALPDAQNLRVAGWFWNGTFSYFFKGRMVPTRLAPDTTTSREWEEADYGVLYINQQQRGRLPADIVAHVRGLKPAAVVRIQGLEYARIYDLRTTRPGEASAGGTPVGAGAP